MGRKKIDKEAEEERQNAAEEERHNAAIGSFVILYLVGGVLGVTLESWFIFGVFAVLGIYYMFKIAFGTPKEDPAPTSRSNHSTAPMIEISITPEQRRKPRQTPAVEQYDDEDEDEDEDEDDDDDYDEDEEDEIEYVTKIAGVTFHNDKSDVGAFLGYVRSDPNNPHDPNAIAIYRTDNKLVGYIPRYEQEEYRSWSAKENLPCIGFINEGDEVDLYGKVKIVDADKSTTTLEMVKYAAWLISNFGVKFAPRGLKIAGTTNLKTKEQWLSALYKYIDNRER